MTARRILHATESLNPNFGGTVTAVTHLMQALGRQGCVSEVVTLDAPDAAWLQPSPVERCHGLGPPQTFYRYCPRMASWLDANLERFDAVLIHGLWRHQSTALWRAAKRQGRPYYVIPHSMLNPWFATQRVKHFRKKVFWRIVEHRILRDARAVLFSSDDERIGSRKTYRPYACREEVLPLGTTDPGESGGSSPDAFRSAYPEVRGRRPLLFLGRLHRVKGLDQLIQALPRCPGFLREAQLVIAGPDQENGLRSQLTAAAQSLGVAERITWTGPLFGPLKQSALAAAELLVVPSHCESTSFAALEALAGALPVLITDKVNIHDRVRLTNAGLIAADNAGSLAEELDRWFRMPPEEREAFRPRARQCFLDHFHVDRTAGRLLQLLRKDLRWDP